MNGCVPRCLSAAWLHMFGSARQAVDVVAGVELLAADGLVMNALLASRIAEK
jgi:hypothetical protein